MDRGSFAVTAVLCLAATCLSACGWIGNWLEGEKTQTPRPPFPYRAEEVVLHSRDGGVQLAGTLTIPDGAGPYPAVLLLSVGGPNDRDQSFGKHKGLLVIADHLTRAGVATLRLDDRGVGGSGGAYLEASWETLASDAADAARFLRARREVDELRIGAIGMSEGGAIAALAAREAGFSSVALLSAPGLKGTAALKLQLETMLSLEGISSAQAETYRALFEEFITIVSRDPSAPKTRDALRDFLEGPGAALVPPYGFVPKDIEARIDFFLGSWYQSNLRFDPELVYGRLSGPVLVIAGGKDLVSPPEEHLAGIKTILDKSSEVTVDYLIIENANHVLQDAKSGLPGEYKSLPVTISPLALDRLSAWHQEALSQKN